MAVVGTVCLLALLTISILLVLLCVRRKQRPRQEGAGGDGGTISRRSVGAKTDVETSSLYCRAASKLTNFEPQNVSFGFFQTFFFKLFFQFFISKLTNFEPQNVSRIKIGKIK